MQILINNYCLSTPNTFSFAQQALHFTDYSISMDFRTTYISFNTKLTAEKQRLM